MLGTEMVAPIERLVCFGRLLGLKVVQLIITVDLKKK